MQNNYFVYILTNKYNTVFYTGITNNLVRRIYEHKNKLVDGVMKKYNIDKLVSHEEIVIKEISRFARNDKVGIEMIINKNLHESELFNKKSR